MFQPGPCHFKKKKLGLAVRKLKQHRKWYNKKQTKKKKNGTDIRCKQILNNQNRCKSRFIPPLTQAPEHETTRKKGAGLGGGRDFFLKYTRKLAYNRKNSLWTHLQNKTTRPNSSVTTWKPASASLRWLHILRGGGGDINSTWSGVSVPTVKPLKPPLNQRNKNNHWLTIYSASRTSFWFAGYSAK